MKMQTKRLFSSFLRSGSYPHNHNQSKYHLRGLKYTIAISGVCYLYFQEELLSKIITHVQGKFYKYRALIHKNREEFEIDEQRKHLYDLFEPEPRISHLSEKIGRQLNALEPFEGDFLSLFVEDKLQELKDNGAQTFYAQKGGGKTMESLRIAKKWKEEEGPVLFFDGTDYVKFEENANIFAKYGVVELRQLKKVLRKIDTEARVQFDFMEYVKRFNKMIPTLLLANSSTESHEKQVSRPTNELKEKQLLIIIDDADDLKLTTKELENRSANAKVEFLLQVRELVKEGFAKVLFLCRESETRNWLKEEFDSGIWKGIAKGSPELKSNVIIEKYLNYVSELTGTRMSETEKFFYFFGVDFNGLVELRKYMQRYKETGRNTPVSIDEFIEKKISDAEGTLRYKELDKTIMKVCKKIDKDWRNEKISAEEKEKLTEILESNGTSLKYKAAAYSICGKPWKELLKDSKP